MRGGVDTLKHAEPILAKKRDHVFHTISPFDFLLAVLIAVASTS
jgi:hypothetical protein